MLLHQAEILSDGKRPTRELNLVIVGGTRPICDKHHKQGSSLRSNLSHGIQVSAHPVLKGLPAAKCQTIHSCLQYQ